MAKEMTLSEFLNEWNSEDPCLLVHTSGSTGQPKPIWVEKQRMRNSARITCQFLGLHAGDTALLCMPLKYIAGKMMVVRSLEQKLHLISVEPSNHPLQGDRVSNQKIHFAAMVPSQVYCSLQVPEERERLRQIDHLIIGGGAITQELQRAIDELDSPGAIWSTYGMTETLSHIALRRLNGREASPYYTPFESVKLSLTDEGCLVIDAPLVHEGRLVTNDRAEILPADADRPLRFRILGRKDNVICSGGVKLQMEQMEEKLRSFLPVPFCFCKRPDPKFGECAVLLIADASAPLSDDIIKSALAHLDCYEQPKEIVHTQELPMTETGKVRRIINDDL